MEKYTMEDLFGFMDAKRPVRVTCTDGRVFEGPCWAYGDVQNEDVPPYFWLRSIICRFGYMIFCNFQKGGRNYFFDISAFCRENYRFLAIITIFLWQIL